MIDELKANKTAIDARAAANKTVINARAAAESGAVNQVVRTGQATTLAAPRSTPLSIQNQGSIDRILGPN